MASQDRTGPNGWYLEGISSGRSGIDLAEGTWRDLGLTGDDYVEVVYNWQHKFCGK